MEREHVWKLVEQFLIESGMSVAAMALADHAGELMEGPYNPPSGSLLRILDEYTEMKKAGEPKEEIFRLPEELLKEGDGQFCRSELATLRGIHDTNIVSVQLLESGLLLTGGVDRTLRVGLLGGLPDAAVMERVGKNVSLAGPVLTLAAHPTMPYLVATGDMAGQVSLVDTNTGIVTSTQAVHAKYVVRVRWDPTGRFLASAAYDRSVSVFQFSDDKPTEPLALLKKLSFQGAAECVAFTPTPTSVDAESTPELIVSVRDDYRLYIYSLPDLTVRTLNMNAFGDTHISFAALDVSVSPNGKYILVSTDRDRLILFDRIEGTVLLSFYGASNDGYSQPRHCWHPSGIYIYATSQDHAIIVWEVSTQKIVARLQGHTSTIRDISFSGAHGLLVSTGFDRTVMLWTQHSI